MNAVIATFDGWRLIKRKLSGLEYEIYSKDGLRKYPNEMNYHESWDILMSVVEKIESLHDSFHGYFGVHISSNSCTIQGTKLDTRPGKEHYAYFNDIVHESKILATHLAVYLFIMWYNENFKKCQN